MAGEAVEQRRLELPGGEPPVVRVVVDRPSRTEGLGLDMVAELSQEIGELLESGNLTGNEPYDLEVTSPGAARPLTEPRHWARNVGRMVQLKQVEGDDLAGLLLSAGALGLLVFGLIEGPDLGWWTPRAGFAIAGWTWPPTAPGSASGSIPAAARLARRKLAGTELTAGV